jgi:glycosyltransferase involved in cell wall biosynthesis
MLHHEQAFKGTDYGLKAMERARRVMPELRVTCFGAQEPPPNSLPEWVHFELRPTPSRLRELYNQHAIFISPSLSEGWALPPAEAMQCGCATVLTDIGGHEYARDGITSLLCPIQTPDVMARKVLELIEDPEKRVKLARDGHKEIAQYTWSKATDRFLKAIDTRPSIG